MGRDIGIFWDWDGVNFDSINAIHKAVSAVFMRDGKEPPTFEEFYIAYDVPWLDYYRAQGIKAPVEKIVEWYYPELSKYYHKCELFEAAVDVLLTLARCSDVITGIISGSPRESIENALTKADLTGIFHFIDGETFVKDEAISMRRQEFDLQPYEVYFVGDLPADMRDGKKAGVNTIGFTGSIYARDRLLFDAGADDCIYEHAELLQFL
jgi:HAD superfamily hydrolase (TIGR01549 family)